MLAGYTHGLNSVVNGSALSGSVAGEVAYLSVYLHDIYFNPSPIEVQWLRVVIIKKSDSSRLRAMVAPIRPVGGIYFHSIHFILPFLPFCLYRFFCKLCSDQIKYSLD